MMGVENIVMDYDTYQTKTKIKKSPFERNPLPMLEQDKVQIALRIPDTRTPHHVHDIVLTWDAAQSFKR